ncbi:probable prolyl 4-hydroxylase 7 [Ricinus communis]|uniref:procollagen-proline 4-dioxygenase n=1 Tax=Ricinus communis TaxID=3988 RepID=B9RUJ2_RICCO|nr:probable prolyl 4-hydroxylase 7 [Ricinus communis]EEF44979.1 prolyl 4-hydroxylase alpha subunit, putative [Ricinus communis]|eukprot:XP_002517437.1 probable prolyl 4-hydroxylase 7 [Ricinus communis]
MEFDKISALFICLLSLFPRFSYSDNEIQGSVLRLKKGVVSSRIFDPTRVTQLSWHPRAFLYKGFLSYEECDHLIDLARDKLEKSMVADNESGKSIESEVRTSSGMFIAKAQDEIVADIEARIAAWTFLPEENGESMQILHYEHGQKYEPHFDYFHDKANQELGGHRVATVLMYLSNVEKGGETVFPNAEGKLSQPKEDSWSDCAKGGYAVKPEKGDALLFFSLHPDATTDSDSLHGSCPVIEGEKWSATKWIHVRSFEKSFKQLGKGDCVDENDHCPLWAKAGECKKNPLYMIGSGGANGYCRKSCKVCTS